MHKYNFFEVQDIVSKRWEEGKEFQFVYDNQRENFIIDTPPPTVSGSLHIGHIFSYIHQDIVARYKRMNGYNVVFPFGFDNNGLPTERYIENKYNVSVKEVGQKEFISICYKGIQSVQDSFVSLWKKLGLSYDWNLTYSTISPDVIKLSQKLFIQLYKKGLVYKKKEPALFCTAFQTSVSQADLEEIEKDTVIITVVFVECEFKEKVLIATTRPELLSGCVAIFVHPDDQRYKHLVGKQVSVPIYNHIVPIMSDDSVVIDKGTGVVMCATFGDGLDVYWFKKYNLPYRQVILSNGRLSNLSGILDGMKVEEARRKIVALLNEMHVVVDCNKIVHRVSVYERSKKEIEYIMLDQWFISILPYKKEFLEIAEKVSWYPSYMKVRYIDWVKNLSWDWCISRQRTFGIPFPIWYDECGNVIIADEQRLPVDPRTEQPYNGNENIKMNYQGEQDVMDTWNTSSLTPYIIIDLVKRVYNVDLALPFSIRPQSHDIIRTWAFDTIVKAYFLDNSVPWHNIIISGHVVTNDREKISKSKENSPLNPSFLINQYPADVIRYWSASAKLGIDTVFSLTEFSKGNKLLVKIWNAAIFISQYTNFDNILLEEAVSLDFNRYILSEFSLMIKKYHDFFYEFNFSHALMEIERFFWFLCDYYLEIVKLYVKGDPGYNEISHLLSFLFYNILLCFSPFIPFVTEYLFQKHYSSFESICMKQFNQFYFVLEDDNFFQKIIIIIDFVRKAKAEQKISLKAGISMCSIYCQDFNMIYFLRKKENMFILKSIIVVDELIIIDKNSKSDSIDKFVWDCNGQLHLYLT